MKISKCQVKKQYVRNFEGMGKHLVLININAIPEMDDTKYHCFFEDKKKPPLDIAINQNEKNIEYISFFIQDEKIIKLEKKYSVNFLNENICINVEGFSEKNPYKYFQNEFMFHIEENNLFVINIISGYEELIAYELSNEIFVLFNTKDVFCGILLKNLKEKEMKVLLESEVIQS
ncbi:hypothetical protein [Gottfriedia solisilvae]|uniref:hypothetical protein n=1 Tax=Gottfriedia solisilvae TaxID=1516104 RepID=UPI003D2ED13D